MSGRNPEVQQHAGHGHRRLQQHRAAGQPPELGDAGVLLDPGPVRPVRAVARLRRGPGRPTRAGPSIGGIARDGSTLTANPGSWDGTPTITYEYQWQRCDASGNNCVDIPGATGGTYTLGPDDVGSTIRVVVTAVNGAGSSSPATSAATGTIGQLAPSNITRPRRQRRRPGRPDADHHDRRLERHRRRSTTTSSGSAATPPATTAPTSPAPPPGATCSPAPTSARRSAARSPPPTPPAPPPRTRSRPARSTPSPPVNTAAPALSGVARDGQTLSAEHRHLDRHRPDRLHLPVAALRRRRRQLRRHRGRDRLELRPRRRRHRPRPCACRSPATNVAGPRHRELLADHRGHPRPAGQHGRARALRHARRTARR